VGYAGGGSGGRGVQTVIDASVGFGGGGSTIAGTTNTGGGGGGGGIGNSIVVSAGGAGGSGVVIISHSNTTPTGTVTGNPVITTVGSNIVYTFTASGTIVVGSNVGFYVPTAPVPAIPGSILLLNSTDAAIKDQTGRNNIITTGDTKLRPISKFSGRGIFFDGTGDNLLLPHNNYLHLNTDFTIEMWVYWISGYGMLLNKGGGTSIAFASYELFIDNVSSNVRFAGSTQNTSYDLGGESTAGNMGAITTSTWTHVALTRSGTTIQGFVNGIQGLTTSSAAALYDSSPRGLAIGSNYITTWATGAVATPFNGYIDNLRITKGVARYTGVFTPPYASYSLR
jgi:hypothetical protein